MQIEQLWAGIEPVPDPDQQSATKRSSKQDAVLAMQQRAEGATVDEVASAMGWQRHTVRGLFSGSLKKKLGLALASAQEERGRVYRLATPEQACAACSRMRRFAGRRSRASPSSTSANFANSGVLSTKPMPRRTSAASCSYELSHTGCRRSLLAACARTRSGSFCGLHESSMRPEQPIHGLAPS